MKTYALPLAVILALCSSAAQAQVHVGIELGLPEAPSLVVVSPGIQVVEGYQGEVFFQGGWYWARRPDGWYRARSPHDHFGWVDNRHVPGGLNRIPAGRYNNWHHDGPRGEGRAMGPRDGGHDHPMGGHDRPMGGRPEGGHRSEGEHRP
jgi:hypothetical protein